MAKPEPWTIEEETQLIGLYRKYHNEKHWYRKVAGILSRTPCSVQGRMKNIRRGRGLTEWRES